MNTNTIIGIECSLLNITVILVLLLLVIQILVNKIKKNYNVNKVISIFSVELTLFCMYYDAASGNMSSQWWLYWMICVMSTISVLITIYKVKK